MALTTVVQRDIAHLMRRAGFGVTPEEWANYVQLGIDGTTDRLLHPENVVEPVDALLQQMGEDIFNFDDLSSLKRWWLFRMARTKRPLLEKMTLFWHNHFATANYKVENSRWMWQQNRLFRQHALGKFPALLKAVALDAAMLSWLDGNENRKGAANENFGRELLELFTLGVNGGYTEADVKAAARAFTGWHWDDAKHKAVFDPDQHDKGVKVFLGHTGRLHADDILNIVAEHPSTARFLSIKLLRFFQQDDPTPNMIDACGHIYMQSGGDIRQMVGSILRSPAFYAPEARFAHFKSPTEYALILMRTLNIPLSYGGEIHDALAQMGQELFNPPDVKGWREGKTWFNTTSLTARQTFTQQVLDSVEQKGKLLERLKVLLKVTGADMDTITRAPQMVDALWQAFLPGHLPSAKTRAALLSCAPPPPADGEKLDEKKDAQKDMKKSDEIDIDTRAPIVLRLLLLVPEYQLA